jgi:hypothetical protein
MLDRHVSAALIVVVDKPARSAKAAHEGISRAWRWRDSGLGLVEILQSRLRELNMSVMKAKYAKPYQGIAVESVDIVTCGRSSLTRVRALGEDVRHTEKVAAGVQEGRGHGRPSRCSERHGVVRELLHTASRCRGRDQGWPDVVGAGRGRTAAPAGDGERDLSPFDGVLRILNALTMTTRWSVTGPLRVFRCGWPAVRSVPRPRRTTRGSKQPVGDRELEDAQVINALVDAHGDDPAFGYRFLVDELERAGIDVGESQVWRLCSQQRLRSTAVRKGRKGKRSRPAVHDDQIRTDFTEAEPNRNWVTDITEHLTVEEGKVY